MELAEIAHFTDDVAAMRAFYRNLLGTEPIADSAGMAIFAVGPTRIFIHKTYEPAKGELPPEDHVAFTVPNVDVACERLSRQGLTIEIPPHDYYWGRSAYLRDPDGHVVELIQSGETK
jgi:catechol 2,3-dioxygenase-like lactoylglutathione lyase family enzyme